MLSQSEKLAPQRVDENLEWGLYIHIPFCQFACHYCDFVKTSHYDEKIVRDYFAALVRHADYWLETIEVFGGGF